MSRPCYHWSVSSTCLLRPMVYFQAILSIGSVNSTCLIRPDSRPYGQHPSHANHRTSKQYLSNTTKLVYFQAINPQQRVLCNRPDGRHPCHANHRSVDNDVHAIVHSACKEILVGLYIVTIKGYHFKGSNTSSISPQKLVQGLFFTFLLLNIKQIVYELNLLSSKLSIGGENRIIWFQEGLTRKFIGGPLWLLDSYRQYDMGVASTKSKTHKYLMFLVSMVTRELNKREARLRQVEKIWSALCQ